jgi:hypothetical protein
VLVGRVDVRKIQELYLFAQQKLAQVVQVVEAPETAPQTRQIVQEVQDQASLVDQVAPGLTVQHVQVVEGEAPAEQEATPCLQVTVVQAERDWPSPYHNIQELLVAAAAVGIRQSLVPRWVRVVAAAAAERVGDEMPRVRPEALIRAAAAAAGRAAAAAATAARAV